MEKRVNTKIIFVLAILLLGSFFVIAHSGTVSAAGTSYCAQKTTSGAWCQNVPLSQVDKNYPSAATSCDSFAPCKLGTCVDSQQGLCSPNTPQIVCNSNGGTWFDKTTDELPQCQLGCCLLGNQAAFVTQTRCKALASDYGLQTNYRTDINTETACIASANSGVEGACVYTQDFQRTCKRTTKADCSNINNGGNSSAEFHEGMLCSAESLATNCGPTKQTTCDPNKDGVYFVDSCGNEANIYDASKINDKAYWTNIINETNSCNPGSNNANSASCGNCNYIGGSTCQTYDRSKAGEQKPNYGDYLCADLSCTYNGKTYQHGEEWCANSPGISTNAPGSQSYVMNCYNGQVNVEECAPYRQEICQQSSVNGFNFAACVANKWQDCTSIDNKKDCLNTDKRDCKWVTGNYKTLTSLFADSNGNPYQVNSKGELTQATSTSTGEAACLPKYPPGFDFWNSGENSTSTATGASGITPDQLCSLGNAQCVAVFEKAIGGDYKCKKNCWCVGVANNARDNDIAANYQNSDWAKSKMSMCVALGDCGNSKNYLGYAGYNNESTVTVTAT